MSNFRTWCSTQERSNHSWWAFFDSLSWSRWVWTFPHLKWHFWSFVRFTVPEIDIYWTGKQGDVILLPVIDLFTSFTVMESASITTAPFKLRVWETPFGKVPGSVRFTLPPKPNCNHQRNKRSTDLRSVSTGKSFLNLVPYVVHMECLPVSSVQSVR